MTESATILRYLKLVHWFLRKDMRQKKGAGGKINFKCLCPYICTLVNFMGRGLYQIQDVEDPQQKLRKSPWHTYEIVQSCNKDV